MSKVGVAYANVDQPKEMVHVTADLDTLLTALARRASAHPTWISHSQSGRENPGDFPTSPLELTCV